jgi:anti-anti-sigma regulatory factor
VPLPPRRQRPALASRSRSRLTLSMDLPTRVITLDGDLDRRTAHLLVDAACALSAVEHGEWVLDTERLGRCDARGLWAISVCSRRALRYGAGLRIVGAPPGLTEALGALRLDRHVTGAERRPGSAGPPEGVCVANGTPPPRRPGLPVSAGSAPELWPSSRPGDSSQLQDCM